MHDIAVIGGGLVGSSLALGLARAGQRVLVLDGGDLSPRASRANFALIWVQGKGLGKPEYALWSRDSAALWPEYCAWLEAEADLPISLSQRGGFSFGLSQAELDLQVSQLEQIDRETAGEAARWELLSAAQARTRAPGLGPDIAGAIYSPADGHINALRLFHAVHRAMARRDVDYRAHHEVSRIEPGAHGFTLSGAWGKLTVPRVVIAAGIGAEALAPHVGLSAPLQRSRGQIVVTEKCAPFFPYVSATIRQTDEGSVMIGDSEESHTDAIHAGPDVASVMAARAAKIFPALANLNVLRTWTGMRVKSRDGFPIYQQSETCPGAFLALCHSGVTLAAAHALIVAPAIAAGALGDRLAPFSDRRFHVSSPV